MINKAVHGPIRTVRVLVDQPRDEVRGESDDKSLMNRMAHQLGYCKQDNNILTVFVLLFIEGRVD